MIIKLMRGFLSSGDPLALSGGWLWDLRESDSAGGWSGLNVWILTCSWSGSLSNSVGLELGSSSVISSSLLLLSEDLLLLSWRQLVELSLGQLWGLWWRKARSSLNEV